VGIRGLLFLSLVGLGSLLALTGLRQLFIAPLDDPVSNAIWFLIQVLPLLGVLPGMLRLRARSFLLAALAAMLYFSHGVVLAVEPALRVLGVLEAVFAVGLVLTATYALRGIRRADAPQ
jgi:uncharacterized membrane protein